jgi:hypothetical protein
MGRDRRVYKEAIEEERRGKVTLLGNTAFLIIVLSAFLLLIITGLYGLKILAGIDLFPGKHMGWIFGL